MRQVAADTPAVSLAAPIEFEPEHPERNLGLAVGAHAVIAALPIEVIPVDGALVGRHAELRGDARVPGAKQGQQRRHEREVAEVVGAELRFEAVDGGLPLGRGHHSRIVDEQVNRDAFAAQSLPQAGHRLERRQIERAQRDNCRRRDRADAFDGGLALTDVAHRQHNFGAGGCDAGGDVESDAVAAARDDGSLSGEVRDGDIDGCAWHGEAPRICLFFDSRSSRGGYPGLVKSLISEPWCGGVE